jgi:hypothetical protein
MTQEYASKQPQGFKNRLENVAIIGATGRIGKVIVSELAKTGMHKVTAVQRTDSTTPLPSHVQVKKADFNNHGSLVEALRGQDVLLIILPTVAPPDQHAKIVEAAAEAGVPWLLPNEWGHDGTNTELGRDVMIGIGKAKDREHIEKLGKSSWIGIACNFWYEYSLSYVHGLHTYGFDIKNRQVIFFDEGTARINTTTWPQTGRAVAKLLSLKVLPDDENDNSPTVSQFRNKYVYISSFLVSQKDIFESLLRVTGTTESDWKVSHESSQERYKSGTEEFHKSQSHLGFARQLYSRTFYPDGSGNYEAKHGLDNDILGLPKEDLDEFTKLAVKMADEN